MTDDRSCIETPDGRQRVYLADASRMVELSDDSVDLVVTSPPYGIGIDYGQGWEGEGLFVRSPTTTPGQVEGPVLSMGDYRQFLARLAPVWRETYRVLKPGAFAAINVAPIHTKTEYFGRSFMLPIVHDIEREWFFLGAEPRWMYIWRANRTRNNSSGTPTTFLGSYGLKDEATGETYGLPLKGQVLREIEVILVFWKPTDRPIPPEREERRRRSRLSFDEWQDCFAQVWEFPGIPKSRSSSGGVIHPAAFPIELPLRLIKGYSVVDDLILDPFAGIGTTGRAARLLNRRFVGYEVEKIYTPHIEETLGAGIESMEDTW